jgi:hypothetical protein
MVKWILSSMEEAISIDGKAMSACFGELLLSMPPWRTKATATQQEKHYPLDATGGFWLG